MVRNILLFSGSSHPQLTDQICTHLGIPPAKIHLSKFSVGETRVEVGDSVRGKDVFIVQTACSSRTTNTGQPGPVSSLNDGLMELLITISACKTASARRVTAVLPLFPYSRQSDLPYNKVGAPLARMPAKAGEDTKYTFESRPGTPGPSAQSRDEKIEKKINGLRLNGDLKLPARARTDTLDSVQSTDSVASGSGSHNGLAQESHASATGSRHPTSAAPATTSASSILPDFKPQRGYKQWVAQAGTLIADLLTCAGADHIITMDLHDPQYQGFFDIPVDNLYGRHLLKRYISHEILPFNGGTEKCIIVSPDAGGAKRATSLADALGMDFALIHKERRNPTSHSNGNGNGPHANSALLLVGQVSGKTAILVDDLADTSNTITRAAKLLKKEGATRVYALVTHGVLSGDGVDRIFHSGLDKVIVTNSVPQDDHVQRMDSLAAAHGKPAGKLEVLEVGGIFAEAIRRVHHGESISVLFQYD